MASGVWAGEAFTTGTLTPLFKAASGLSSVWVLCSPTPFLIDTVCLYRHIHTLNNVTATSTLWQTLRLEGAFVYGCPHYCVIL